MNRFYHAQGKPLLVVGGQPEKEILRFPTQFSASDRRQTIIKSRHLPTGSTAILIKISQMKTKEKKKEN